MAVKRCTKLYVEVQVQGVCSCGSVDWFVDEWSLVRVCFFSIEDIADECFAKKLMLNAYLGTWR